MFIFDFSSTARLLLGTAFAVATAAVQAATVNYELGMCQVLLPTLGVVISPTGDGDIYLYEYHSDLYNSHNTDPRYKGFTFDDDTVKVTLLKAPAHGKLVHEESTVSNNSYRYLPNEGYSGEDRLAMQVEKNGIKVRIQYLIKVPRDGESPQYLCDPEVWKISSTSIVAS